MQIFHHIEEINLAGPTYLTIGNFDGLHRGHQALIEQMQAEAKRDGHADACTALMTFEPHPVLFFRPDTPLHLLTTPRERIELAANLGIDVGIIQPFDQQTAALSARDFMQMLVSHVGLYCLVVGPDFALGRKREGTIDVLRSLGDELGYRVVVIEPVHASDEEVRSFNIRRHLYEGDVVHAQRLLGRVYTVSGVVVDGDKRGRTIGVPTANLDIPSARILPADGVYATWAWIGRPGESKPYGSATNIGVRPTVDGTQRRVEAHLFDFPPPGESGDLYGQTLTVGFVARLRGEQRFNGLDELVAQIQRDLHAAREILANQNPGESVPHQ
ncbi:MAG: bifunctional riboflavin kinase/FAD synthetase [Caldilineaceae bacterium]